MYFISPQLDIFCLKMSGFYCFFIKSSEILCAQCELASAQEQLEAAHEQAEETSRRHGEQPTAQVSTLIATGDLGRSLQATTQVSASQQQAT